MLSVCFDCVSLLLYLRETGLFLGLFWYWFGYLWVRLLVDLWGCCLGSLY